MPVPDAGGDSPQPPPSEQNASIEAAPQPAWPSPTTEPVAAPIEAALAGWRRIDFSSPLAFGALAVAYVASRAPFLNDGYGANANAWRVALSAYWLRQHHEYYPSRVPGYPLPDLASAAVIRGGWLATNSLTLLISLAGLWLFARIVRELELPTAPLVVLGFAFTPLLWINSMTTMDYMWALTFILACYYALLLGQVPLAGILLGLAAASRLTSIAFIVPFSVYVVRDGRRRELRDFVVWSIAVTMLAFLPVIWRYGPDFINFYDARVSSGEVLRVVAEGCLGLIGAAAVVFAAALSLPRLSRLPSDFVRDKHVTLWVLIIVFTVLMFARLPHEAAFLIPAYPFGFFVMSRYFRTGALVFAIAAIVIAGFVDVRTRGADLNAHALRHALIGQGLVLANRSTMDAQLAFTHELEQQPIANHSIVMLGYSYPQFAVLNRQRLTIGTLETDTSAYSELSDKGTAVDGQRAITYVSVLDRADFDRFLADRFNIYYTPDAGRATLALFGYRPGSFDGRNGVPVKQIAIAGAPPRAIGEANTPR